MYKDIDLTNRNLGEELLRNASGDLWYDVWLKYVCENGGESSDVLAWCVDPDHPDVAPIDPQQAVDEAQPLIDEVIEHLRLDSPQEALQAARRASEILTHGSSVYQRGRGLPPTMRHYAVRAWVIRKFNPHPTHPRQSTVSWAKLADLLFVKEGKCPRTIHDDDGRVETCGRSRHQYNDRCVKALTTAVGNLESAMKKDGIPLDK